MAQKEERKAAVCNKHTSYFVSIWSMFLLQLKKLFTYQSFTFHWSTHVLQLGNLLGARIFADVWVLQRLKRMSNSVWSVSCTFSQETYFSLTICHWLEISDRYSKTLKSGPRRGACQQACRPQVVHPQKCWHKLSLRMMLFWPWRRSFSVRPPCPSTAWSGACSGLLLLGTPPAVHNLTD